MHSKVSINVVSADVNVIARYSKPLMYVQEIFVWSDICKGSIVVERELPLICRIYLDKQNIMYQNPYEVPFKLGQFQDVHLYIQKYTRLISVWGSDSDTATEKPSISLNTLGSMYVSDPAVWLSFHENMIEGKLNPGQNRWRQIGGGGIAGMYAKKPYMLPVNPHVTKKPLEKVVLGKQVSYVTAIEEIERCH